MHAMNRIIFDMDQSECHSNKPCKYIIRYKRAKADNIANRLAKASMWFVGIFFFFGGSDQITGFDKYDNAI